jgi:uncharacterized protein (TIGR03437 family)
VKRQLLILAGLALFCCGIMGLKNILTSTSAQSPTSELVVAQLPVPNNSSLIRIRSVSNDGQRVVFESPGNYTGGNSDGNFDIFVKNADSTDVIQITHTGDYTDTTGVNIDVDCFAPAISGDGNRIVFASNAPSLDPASPNNNGNYELYIADFPPGATIATFRRITNTGRETATENLRANFTNFNPSISDDGTVIAFESTRQTFNAVNMFSGFVANNPDFNTEIMVADMGEMPETPGQYSQVTVSNRADRPPSFLVEGFNSTPRLSGNGETLVFVSDYNYDNNKNSDWNEEFFHCRLSDNNILQVTQTESPRNTYKAVVPIFDPVNLIFSIDVSAPTNLLDPNSKPLNLDGTRLVFESSGNINGSNMNKARQIWICNINPDRSVSISPIINQAVSASPTQDELSRLDHTFKPSIDSAGNLITFNSTLNLAPTSPSDVNTDNPDGSSELFMFDIATGGFRQLTFTAISPAFLDQRLNKTPSFISNLSPIGDRTISFHYSVQSFLPNATNIIDPFQVVIRPVIRNAGGATILNSASFVPTQVARGSLNTVFGSELANSTLPLSGQSYIQDGVTVKVNNIAALLTRLSPTQVGFVMPQGIANGVGLPFTVNNNGVQSTGTINVVDASPGIFTVSGDGTGVPVARCLSKLMTGENVYYDLPCVPSNDNMTSILFAFGTGWRNGTGNLQVKVNDRTLDAIYSGRQGGGVLMDQFNVVIPADLAGVTNAALSVVAPSTTIESNMTNISFVGPPTTITIESDGAGGAAVDCLIKTPGVPDQYTPPPCQVSNGSTIGVLVVYGVGWRGAPSTQVRIGDQLFTPIYSGPRGPGLRDQVNLILDPSLADSTGLLSVTIPGTSIESNRLSISFQPLP